MSLIRLAIRKKRFVPVTPPPPGGGTGLAMPNGAVNNFGTAADFYDSVGVSTHSDHAAPYPNWGNPVNMLTDLYELGVRHIRDGGNFTNMGNDAMAWRDTWVAVRNRNNNLPASPTSTDRGHPLFVHLHTVGWGDPVTGQGPFNYPPNTGYPVSCLNYAIGRPYKPVEWLYNFSGGSNGWGHYDGNASANIAQNMPVSHNNEIGFRIPDGTTTPANGHLPNPWAWSEPELAWAHIGCIAAKNEAGLGWPDSHVAHTFMTPWTQAITAAKDAKTAEVVGGPPRIVGGRITLGSQIKVNQIPVSTTVVMSNGPLSDTYGDWSKARSPKVADVGDRHPYNPGVNPSREWVQSQVGYGTGNNRNASGLLANPPDPSKGLPMFITEDGQVTSADSGYMASNAGSHGGYWPSPEDVGAEYAVRMYLLNWSQGIRRTFWYEFYNEFGEVTVEGAFGFLRQNRAKKAVFWAVRNMLRLVGFTEPSLAAQTKLNITFSGFATGSNHQHTPAGVEYVQNGIGAGGTVRLEVPQMQQSDDTWLQWMVPTQSLWDREPGNHNGTSFVALSNATAGRETISTSNVTVQLPAGAWTAQIASPTSGMTPNPTAATHTWSNPDNGFAWTDININNANQITVPMSGYTKVLKITKAVATGDPAEPPQLLTVTKGPYAAGTSFATAMAGAGSGDVVGLQAGAFNWGTQTPPAGVTIQGATGGSVVNGQFTFTNDNAKLRNLTVRAVTGDTQKSVLEIDADGVEVDWCELDGTPITHTTAPKPSTVFIGGIAVQVQNVKIRRCKISGPTNGDSQSHAFYIANPGPGCLIERCWVYNFPGYGLHFNTNGSDLLAYRNVVDDSATRGAAVFSTESGGGPQNNTIDTCVLTAAGGGGVGAIHVIAGTNYASNSLLKTPGVTTPGTGTLNQSGNTVVATVTYQNAAARDYRIPANNNFQFIPGPTATPVAPIPTNLPIVVPSSGSTPATLRTGTTAGPRLHLKAINIWGLPDDITNNVTVSGSAFHLNQYNNRDAICATVAGWGANAIRMRTHATDYAGAPSAATDSLTKSQILDRIEAWQIAAAAQNMYFCLCPWDALDGANSGVNWANATAQATLKAFFTDVFARFGPDPWVFYELSNEPNGLTFAQWDGTVRALISHFRQTLFYDGILVVDPPNWANSGGATTTAGNAAGYSDSFYSGIEGYDAQQSGNPHQIVFAKHDYSNNSPYGGTFNATQWQNGMGGPQIKHLIWENEFGNYNAGGPDPDTNDTWSSNMAAAARDKFSSMLNYVGAAPFLFGPWSDANAITTSNNSTPTSPWGTTVRDVYFGSGSPPPASLLAPGVVANGSTGQPEGGVIRDGPSLGADLARVEFDINNDVSVAGAARTAMDATFTSYANVGMKILMLAAGVDYSNTVPTNTQCTNIAGWAARYGPGGAFWTGYTGTDRPISSIEFGNEESYNYKLGPETSTAYADKAKHYAAAFVTTKNAIVAGGSGVKLLAIGDASGSAFFPNWIDNMFIQVSNFSSFVDGWTVHPYGPTHNTKIQRMVDLLAGKGAPSSIPIDITEWGVANDESSPGVGRNLSDNYGYPTNLNYAQAATTLLNQSTAMRTNANFGSRIRHLMLYQAHDNQPKGGPSTDREGYFGGRTSTGVDKGDFSTAYRTILNL